MNRIIIETMMGQNRIAVTRKDVLEHFFIERETDVGNYGNIYLGKVEQIKPGMQCAFVNIGSDKNALLHVSDIEPNPGEWPIQKLLKQGQDLVVQVRKEEIDGKGGRLTTKYWLSGHFIVLLPTDNRVYVSKKIKDTPHVKMLKEEAQRLKDDDVGMILRTEAANVDFQLIEKEYRYLMQKWRRVNSKIHYPPKLLLKDKGPVLKTIRDYYTAEIDEIVLNEDTYLPEIEDYFESYFPDQIDKIKVKRRLNLFGSLGIEEQVKRLYARKVWLESGGYVIIDKTEAFTVVDVNSGKFTGRKSQEETNMKINLEATEVIADQLRLRNISGIILIDYINLNLDSSKERLLKKWRQMREKDKVSLTVVGFSDLSLLELTRKQQGKSISNINQQTCPMCNGSGHIYSQEEFFYRCLWKLDQDLSLLEQNRIKIVISPYLKAVIDEMNYFQAGYTFDQMLEEFYNISVQVEVSINQEFDQMILLPLND
ncbi:MAG TPA: hypothetical protein DHN33_11760 [Eubacteriaceae bacterium]|nr:hypothetical protein [Eubacteriaceae bacterium]